MIKAWRATFEVELQRALRLHRDRDGRAAPQRLIDAMGYSALAGGKRLRPLLVLACCDANKSASLENAYCAAIAVEYIHTYSLIHDDLPALDNDDLRRGKPSLHKAFDEATAILAGDALLTDAFAILARAPVNAAAQVLELALAAGSAGMVGGQFDDVYGEGDDVARLTDVHARKTGRLFVASCAMGALSADASAAAVDDAREFGRRFGLAFQIADDVLDVTGTADKGAGRDAKNKKATFATVLGVDAALTRAREEADAASAIATRLRSPVLAELARLAVERAH